MKVPSIKPNLITRTTWIKLRVSPAEKLIIVSKAKARGQTVADFIRQHALNYRLRQTHLQKERIRQLARIGANLNQLARFANTYKSKADTLHILLKLLSLEQEIKAYSEHICT